MEAFMADLMHVVLDSSLRPDSPVGAIPDFRVVEDLPSDRDVVMSTGCDNCITICSGGPCCF
jgi:hypothetical protein